jgi:hypothetical protein
MKPVKGTFSSNPIPFLNIQPLPMPFREKGAMKLIHFHCCCCCWGEKRKKKQWRRRKKGREKVSGKILITNNALGYVWNFSSLSFSPPQCLNSSHCSAYSTHSTQQSRAGLYAMKKGFSLPLALSLSLPPIHFFILFFDINFPSRSMVPLSEVSERKGERKRGRKSERL